ncbi:family 2 glycosyl transferase [Nitzschia inconspicua]|uniref:Family 2 glycosyl transferase n=1 Tax=Nitzschia inconspicua TaxID=303405 RepID=A0A9K3Q1X7_9STRA|nr:family 2 glycosyl transferase [Nitzschia inconspicua]
MRFLRLEKICNLRATVPAYVKFWIVVDNPIDSHVSTVKDLRTRMNNDQLQVSNNYFINVIHYSENRGASYARNTGYNYSTADYIIFLDDDIVPGENLLDAYIGAIRRYPDAKVYVGLTELPQACNLWTEMLSACNVGYFYSIAQKMTRPSWGVTGNLMVRGSRFNPTIQFKSIYPKTGGGEDIDFVYQYKRFYAPQGQRVTVGVPQAKVFHPRWREVGVFYRQIVGWARGDALCITEWPEKTFLIFPNCVEHVFFIIVPTTAYLRRPVAGFVAAASVIAIESLMKGFSYFEDVLSSPHKKSHARLALYKGFHYTRYVDASTGLMVDRAGYTIEKRFFLFS